MALLFLSLCLSLSHTHVLFVFLHYINFKIIMQKDLNRNYSQGLIATPEKKLQLLNLDIWVNFNKRFSPGVK